MAPVAAIHRLAEWQHFCSFGLFFEHKLSCDQFFNVISVGDLLSFAVILVQYFQAGF